MLSVSIILYMNLERPFAVENWGWEYYIGSQI